MKSIPEVPEKYSKSTPRSTARDAPARGEYFLSAFGILLKEDGSHLQLPALPQQRQVNDWSPWRRQGAWPGEMKQGSLRHAAWQNQTRTLAVRNQTSVLSPGHGNHTGCGTPHHHQGGVINYTEKIIPGRRVGVIITPFSD